MMALHSTDSDNCPEIRYVAAQLACMLQAFTPIATMVALFLAGLEVPGKRLILAVFLIAVGTAIASYGKVLSSHIRQAFAGQ